MDNTSLRSFKYNKRGFQALVVFSFVLVMQGVSAMEFRVGGSKGWSLPDSNGPSYIQWAEMNRFQIGDSLLFVYQPDKDLVMHVNQEDYANCNTATPIATYSDGNTMFRFDRSGPYYFISGIKENCLKNEKLIAVVMADRNNHSSNSNHTTSGSPPPPPSPSPSPSLSPSPSPISDSPPPSPFSDSTPPSAAPASPPPSGSIEIVPAPVGEESPSPPPPSGLSGLIVPSTPAEESPPPTSPRSGATSLKYMSLTVCAGAFLGSSLLLDL